MTNRKLFESSKEVKMKRIITTTAVYLTIVTGIFAASPVWKVSKGSNYIYIGGTVHLLSKSDYPLPKAFDKAYNDSKKVVFEVDINEASSGAFAQKLLLNNMYMGDDDITKHLKPETVRKLDKFLKSKNMSFESLKKMKPGFFTIMLATVEMQRLGMSESGVDQFYNDKVTKDKKQTGALETIDQQLEFISKMGEGNEDELILHTINELSEMESMMSKIKVAWRKGDLVGLEKAALADWIEDFPEIYKALLVDRNNNWMPQIKALFSSKEVEFVLVGALHLSGDKGLIKQLKKAGYKVKQME